VTEQEMREKVVNGLMCIAGDVFFCAHCKYSDVNGSGRGDRCKRDCAKDALALLKAQEPVEPVRMNHTENKYRDHYRCPICKENLSYEQNYCPDCGRKVKWQ
jgi:hypothetical protein